MRVLNHTCGTHFGDTKLVVSIVFSPVFESLFIMLILSIAGRRVFSFCKPSLGPTSTNLT